MKNLLKTALIVLINNALFMGSSAVSLTTLKKDKIKDDDTTYYTGLISSAPSTGYIAPSDSSYSLSLIAAPAWLSRARKKERQLKTPPKTSKTTETSVPSYLSRTPTPHFSLKSCYYPSVLIFWLTSFCTFFDVFYCLYIKKTSSLNQTRNW